MNKFETENEIKILFENLSLQYLDSNKNLYPEIEDVDLRISNYYMDNFNEFRYLESKYGEKLSARFKAPMYVKKINDKIGYGLFTAGPLKVDEYIGEYTGFVQEAHSYDISDKDTSTKTEYAWDYPDEISGLPPLEINARHGGGILRFANHSFQPNLRIEHTVVNNEWVIFFVADEDIESDSELYVDYGDAYWAVKSREVII